MRVVEYIILVIIVIISVMLMTIFTGKELNRSEDQELQVYNRQIQYHDKDESVSINIKIEGAPDDDSK